MAYFNVYKKSFRMWPRYVKDRIHSTYMNFGGSVVTTGASAILSLRSPAMMNLVMHQGWLAIAGIMVAMIGSGMVAQSILTKRALVLNKLPGWCTHKSLML